MAKFFNKDIVYPDIFNNRQLLIWTLKETLKIAGWTHVASGDGNALFSTTPGNGNDVITGIGTGANGISNTRAWWIGQEPSGGTGPYVGTRQILLQAGDNVTTGASAEQRWAYSFSDGFSGGAPDANTPPDFGADTQFIIGGGTPSVPVFVTNGVTAGSPNTWQFMASDKNDGDRGSFYMVGYATASTTLTSFFSFSSVSKYSDDGVKNDEDPYVITNLAVSNNADLQDVHLKNTATNGSHSWFGKGSGGPEAWQTCCFPTHFANNLVLAMGINHITGKYDHPFLEVVRPDSDTSPKGWKGISDIIGRETGGRAFRDTFDSGNGNIWTTFNKIILPWDSLTEPVS